jgi:hypothetical protein
VSIAKSVVFFYTLKKPPKLSIDILDSAQSDTTPKALNKAFFVFSKFYLSLLVLVLPFLDMKIIKLGTKWNNIFFHWNFEKIKIKKNTVQ